METNKLRSQFYIFLIFLSFVIFAFLIFGYATYEEQYKKDIKSSIQNEVDFHEKKILSSLSSATQKISTQKEHFVFIHNDISKTLQAEQGYDLIKLKDEIKQKYLEFHLDVELFLINKDYIIYDTTYKKDLGFDLSEITEAKQYLDQTTKDGNIYLSEFISTDALDMKYKIYSYSKIKDGLYLEIGFIDRTLTNTLGSLLEEKINFQTNITLYNVSKDDKQYYYYMLKKRDFALSKKDQYAKFKKFGLEEKTEDLVIGALHSDTGIFTIDDGVYTVYTNIFKKSMFSTLGMENIVMKVEIDVKNKMKFIDRLQTLFVFSLFLTFIIFIFLFFFIRNKFTRPIEKILNALSSSRKIKDKKILALDNEFTDIANKYNTLFDTLNLEINRNKKLLMIDPLTNAYNRKAFDEKIIELLSAYNRYKIPFSLVLFDIDDFKLINDNYGHLSGDDVLKTLVSLITKNIRDTDTLYRVGGEEFIVICNHTSGKNAVIVAEKLRVLISKSLNVIENKNITVSIGVTEVTQGDTQEIIYKRVDDNLYYSKNNGKNRVTSD